jgi:hypothetical protein
LLDSASVTLNVIKDIGGQLELHSPTEAAAKELHMITTDLLEVGLQMTLAQLASQMPAGDDPIEVATRRYSERMTRLIFFKLRPKLDGDKLVMNYTNDASGQIAAMGTVVALLLPAVQAAREAARRASSANNLKQIALAMHNYHDAYRRFPAAASLDEDGKPLLSWRVHILPYVGENALYKEFHLDEPWNSKHNIKLLERMPLIYKNPSSQLQGPMSNYLLPTGKGSIFEDPKKEVGLRDITDGSSNTILALEVNDEKAVKWTQPGDLAYDMDDPLVGLGNAHPGGFMAAFGDGSVRFIAQTIDEELFGFLLGMADGQRTDF